MNNFYQAYSFTWSGRIDDTQDRDSFRWHQVVELIDLTKVDNTLSRGKINFCLLGFCCDEGVKRNLGREGAAKGPRSIRRELANLAVNFSEETKVFDAGNIVCHNDNLENSQQALAEAVEKILAINMFPILLGGGHEIALGHYMGLDRFRSQKNNRHKTAIINFDAHLDMRPFDKGASSGTMFYQIAEHCRTENKPFNYLCIGTQTYANTKSLYNRADEFGAQYIQAKDIASGLSDDIKNQISKYIKQADDVYITICSDVFNAANAPGVSATQPFGLDPDVVLETMKFILDTGKVSSFDIAEVSPRFDQDNRTAKLAAVFIYALVNKLVID